MTAQEIIQLLDLKPLPKEGGFYHEVYRAAGEIPKSALKGHAGKRNFSTAIYYLITPTEFSALHRVASDEIFHFYAGDPVEMVMIDAQGKLQGRRLGNDLTSAMPQVVVPAKVWQGSRLVEGGAWALLGCTVAPGFEFADFETATVEELGKQFPQHLETIRRYTHI